MWKIVIIQEKKVLNENIWDFLTAVKNKKEKKMYIKPKILTINKNKMVIVMN